MVMPAPANVDLDYIDSISYTKNTPEKLLLAAVVLAAIKDATSVCKNTRSSPTSLVSTEAKQWILSDEVAPFTFMWCLGYLSDSGDIVGLAAKLRKALFSNKKSFKIIPSTIHRTPKRFRMPSGPRGHYKKRLRNI